MKKIGKMFNFVILTMSYGTRLECWWAWLWWIMWG